MRLFHALALPAGAALAARRAVPAQAPASRLAGGDRADARARRCSTCSRASTSRRRRSPGGRRRCCSPAARAFPVRHDPITLRSAIWRVPLLAARGLLARGRSPRGPPRDTRRGATIAARDRRPAAVAAGPDPLPPPLRWIPLGVHLIELAHAAGDRVRDLPAAGRAADAARARRPRGRRRARPRPRHRHAVVLQAARRQALLLQPRTRGAFVGYRIENGVLLLSGDPVGPTRRSPRCSRELRAFADIRGLKLGAVGASENLCPLYEELGLRTIYLGDEAIVELDEFSLEGRAIRKVRQSVSRLAKAGYTRRAARAPRPRSGDDRARSSRCSSAAARALPSADSRWRWTRSAGQ